MKESVNRSSNKEGSDRKLEAVPGGKDVPDIPALMAEIRARVTADIARSKDARLPLQKKNADINAGSERAAGEMLQSEELRALNRGHSYALNINPASITTHRGGFIGNIITKAKRKFLTMLRDSLLKEYFQSEHEFHANLVRYLNDLTRYIDSRDAANFWELVRKVDVDVTRAMERIERIADEDAASRASAERRIFDTLNTDILSIQKGLDALTEQAASISMLDKTVKGLEHIVSQAPQEVRVAAQSKSTAEPLDRSYLLFENRFRGSEQEIAERLGRYADMFSGSTLPILELGAGRGELQALLRERKIPSYGVDTDRAMVEASTARGADVRLGDGIAHLRSAAERSLGGVIAIQVIEHLPNEVLRELIAQAKRAVCPGGKVIFETINPQSVLALSSNYFRDPTHVMPIHPDTIKYQMELLGFRDCEVRYLSRVPDGARLSEISVEPFMTPRWAAAMERINGNIRRLNDFLYGYQDFCIIGSVP